MTALSFRASRVLAPAASLQGGISANTRTPLRNGHACMLHYALLHLYGYALSLDDLKAFRVSSCPLLPQVSAQP